MLAPRAEIEPTTCAAHGSANAAERMDAREPGAAHGRANAAERMDAREPVLHTDVRMRRSAWMRASRLLTNKPLCQLSYLGKA